MKRYPLIAALLVGGFVLAQAAWNPTRPTNFFNTVRFQSMAEASFPDGGASTPGAVLFGTTRNELYLTIDGIWTRFAPRSYNGSLAFDFGALSNNPLEASCQVTTTATVTGASIGDHCDVSTNLGQDGGAGLALEAQLTCASTTNGAIGKLCVHFTDGGSYNLHDAGFFFRVTAR